MGTFTIVQMLWKYWNTPNFSLFRYETIRHPFVNMPTWVDQLSARIRRLMVPVLAVCAAIFVIAGVLSLCGLSNIPLFTVCLGSGLFVGFIAMLLLIYLWPVLVAVSASGVIVEERERLTWDILLSIPISWSDLVLAKLAYSQRRINAFGELLFWVQGMLLVLIFILIIADVGRGQRLTSFDGFIILILVVLSMAEFAIARAQDYVLAGLIGLIASLVAESRQNALVVAFFGSISMVLLRAMLTAVLIALVQNPQVLPAQMLLLATGPGSVLVLVVSPLVAAFVLILMVAARECLIRVLFHWLIEHIGEVRLPISM